MDINNQLEIIRKNFTESKKKYDQSSRSDFWEKFYNKSNISNFTEKDLLNFRRPKIFGSKISKGMDDDFGFFTSVETLIDFLNINKKEELKKYTELVIGNPKYYSVSDLDFNHHEVTTVKLMQDISSNISENHKIICEIGAGFGSLASKLKKKYPNLTIILIDLPESIILQTFYLTSLFPEKKFFLNNDLQKNEDLLKEKKYDFIIIPPWEKNKLPFKGKIDFFINTHSFQEMGKETIQDYFNFIHRNISSNGKFFCLNKYSKVINNKDIKISEYPYDDYWKMINNSIGWRNKNMHEILVERVSEKNFDTRKIIRNLEKEINKDKKRSNLLTFFKIFLRKLLDLFIFFIPKKILLKIFKMYL